jgi:hypothetical protein
MREKFLWKSLVVVIGCAIITLYAGVAAVNAAAVGDTVNNIQIRDANDKPAVVPGIGTTAVGLIYSDTEASDLSDSLADAITAKKFDKSLYTGVGVADLKDSAAPNFIIRAVVKSKIEKYKSIILTDADLSLPRAWNLGNCDNKSIYILVGKDKKIKYIRYVDKKTPWSKVEIASVLKIIEDLLKAK